MTGPSSGTVPRYRTLIRVWRAEWFQFHPYRLAIPQRVWTVELLSTLARIQRSRVVHLWAGRRRWRPQRRKLKPIISRRRSDAGKRMCDERMQKPDFQVIAAGASLLEWRDIRRIRYSLPTNAQTLYRLKGNIFPLRNWARHDLSCPDLAFPFSFQAMARRDFCNGLSGRLHWKYLLERWRMAI